MIESYLVLAERIRKELDDLERLVARANRAVSTAKKNPQDTDLFLDSASLNLHDIYSGFERIFKQIAATVDGTVPTGAEWHREILEQMGLDLPRVRPPILTQEAIQSLDEYLRFRHVVRNVYTFSFDPERIGRLVKELDAVFEKVKQELSAFADFLETVSGK
jgi:ABC-type transporter Mla subunit MlaD